MQECGNAGMRECRNAGMQECGNVENVENFLETVQKSVSGGLVPLQG